MLRLILALGVRVGKPLIIKAVMKEFISRGLDKKYSKKIEEWKKYKREKKYASELDEEFMEEIEIFEKEIKGWTLKELEIIWEL